MKKYIVYIFNNIAYNDQYMFECWERQKDNKWLCIKDSRTGRLGMVAKTAISAEEFTRVDRVAYEADTIEDLIIQFPDLIL